MIRIKVSPANKRQSEREREEDRPNANTVYGRFDFNDIRRMNE